ncbi:cysteine-rich RLK (RECEPTOR-like protein kinase) 8 [Striga hermonthica]|uniref:Cysteine-rich RLK (RECEPTOR-like protein kinase) 8 n=1 Tax=Striga hermonthica TaxID=68872 RepID=A0A9N7ND02_STRHE|nr:cysteine-rich RLK (RECEPTOR-like protein kinase) 8 [Striga hermonthica]
MGYDLLRDLHAVPTSSPTLYSDNTSALFLTQNPVSHKRAKHIDIDYQFVRELVDSGRLFTKFMESDNQVVDIFTKSLLHGLFDYFRTKLRISVADTT